MTTADLLADKVATAKSLAAWAEQTTLDDDIKETIGNLRCLAETATSALETAVKRAREKGATWQQIGDLMHTTRQAAQMRFGG